jgi:hypothetical protein
MNNFVLRNISKVLAIKLSNILNKLLSFTTSTSFFSILKQRKAAHLTKDNT